MMAAIRSKSMAVAVCVAPTVAETAYVLRSLKVKVMVYTSPVVGFVAVIVSTCLTGVVALNRSAGSKVPAVKIGDVDVGVTRNEAVGDATPPLRYTRELASVANVY